MEQEAQRQIRDLEEQHRDRMLHQGYLAQFYLDSATDFSFQVWTNQLARQGDPKALIAGMAETISGIDPAEFQAAVENDTNQKPKRVFDQD